MNGTRDRFEGERGRWDDLQADPVRLPSHEAPLSASLDNDNIPYFCGLDYIAFRHIGHLGATEIVLQYADHCSKQPP